MENSVKTIPCILVVEDHGDTLKFLDIFLKKNFKVITAPNGIMGEQLFFKNQVDLVLLDILMPGQNGLETLKKIRSSERGKKVPIILLSGRNTQKDIEQGLSFGADDFLAKPFDHKELLFRIQSLLHRKSQMESDPVIQYLDLVLKAKNREVFYQDRKIDLTLTEFDLLRLLIERRGVTISREDIQNEIWKDTPQERSDRTIDVHIRAIRRKIPELEKLIQSVYGVGYRVITD